MNNKLKPVVQVEVRTSIKVPLSNGKYNGQLFTFNNLCEDKEHLAIGLGGWRYVSTPLVRIHSECLIGDLFGSQKCDCQFQLQESIQEINSFGGFLLYLRQQGRGAGLYNEIESYVLQKQGLNTYQANRALEFSEDPRDYRAAAEMLQALDVKTVDLYSNNSDKEEQLIFYGIDVRKRISTGLQINQHNADYLRTKMQRGHCYNMKNI